MMKETVDELGETQSRRATFPRSTEKLLIQRGASAIEQEKLRGLDCLVERSEGSLLDPGCTSVGWGKQLGALNLLRRACKWLGEPGNQKCPHGWGRECGCIGLKSTGY